MSSSLFSYIRRSLPSFIEQTAFWDALINDAFRENDSQKFDSAKIRLLQAYPASTLSLVQDAFQPINRIGEGTRSEVYLIPRLPEYVLQVPKNFSVEDIPKNFLFTWESDPMPGYNIGQVVAQCHHRQLKVLRYQPGVTYAIPYSVIFQAYDIDAVLGRGDSVRLSDIVAYREGYTQHLFKISQMPQKAYNKLARLIAKLPEYGLHFDPCSLNVLVDEQEQAFNTVDHLECIGPYENILGMACALLDSMYVDLDEHAIMPDGQKNPQPLALDPYLITVRKTILTKILRAAYAACLPVPEETCPMNTFGFRQRAFDMDYIFKIAGMEGQWPICQQHLLNMPLKKRFSRMQFETLLSA